MRSGDRAHQFAVEALARSQNVADRQRRVQPELERGVAELDVEVDQAGLATRDRFAGGKARGELGQQRGRPDPPLALDDSNDFRPPAARTHALRGDDAADRIERGLELGGIERQRHHVVRPGANQLAHKLQRRFIGGGDQRHRPGGKLGEARDRRRVVFADLDDTGGSTGQRCGFDRIGQIDDDQLKRKVGDFGTNQRAGFAFDPGEQQAHRRGAGIGLPLCARAIRRMHTHTLPQLDTVPALSSAVSVVRKSGRETLRSISPTAGLKVIPVRVTVTNGEMSVPFGSPA